MIQAATRRVYASDRAALLRSDRIERDGATVRLISIHGETLRERTYRGSLPERWAHRQACEWGRKFAAWYADEDSDEPSPRGERL